MTTQCLWYYGRMDTSNKNDNQATAPQTDPVQTNEQTTPPTKSVAGSAFHRLSHKWALFAVAILVVVGGIGAGVYALTSEDKAPAANTSNKKDAKDKDDEDNFSTSDTKAVAEPKNDLYKDRTSAMDSQAENAVSNDSTLTVTGVTTMTPDYYSQPGKQTFKRIDFTIHNNSSVERTYGSQAGANYMVRGVTPSGEIKEPLSLPGSILWQSSKITAGGSAEGYILFKLDAAIAKLEWKAPGNTDTLYYLIPAE